MDLYNLVVSAKLSKGEGGDVDVDSLSVTENGTYTAQTGHAYNPVTVNVPQSGIVPTGTSAITANGIYDITNFASVDVNVSGGGGGDHDDEDAIIMRTISGAYMNSRVTTIGASIFQACKSLETVNFPNVTLISTAAFMNCTSLNTARFPKAATIYGNVFYSCSNLMSLYLLASSVATLSNANALQNTAISKSTYTGSFGSIYVPASLVDSYKTAQYWSAYADRITSYVE